MRASAPTIYNRTWESSYTNSIKYIVYYSERGCYQEHIRGACTEWNEVLNVNSTKQPHEYSSDCFGTPSLAMTLLGCHRERKRSDLVFLGIASSRSLSWALRLAQCKLRRRIPRNDMTHYAQLNNRIGIRTISPLEFSIKAFGWR